MPYISLINAAESLQSSSKASGIIQKLGGPWPPPTSIRRAIAPRQWTEVRGWCTPKHPLLHPIGSPGSNYEQTQFVFPTSVSFPQSVDAVVAIVKDAEANQQRVHAYGSLWSFSDCALTPDVLVDTSSLNKERPNLDPAFNGNQPPHVYHVEAGITIHELYTNLNNKGLALETMGGASGQTLAGAVSTGTHGGDLFMPPLADSVLAIHLVAAGGIQYWIEPTAAITDKALLRQFVVPDIAPEHIIHDDNWFNSVLVSMGCMGIIYAVVLRVRPQYNLIETTTETTWQSFKQNAAAQLNHNSIRFLQLALNPYADDNGNNFTLMTTRQEGDISGFPRISAPTGVDGAIGDLLKDIDILLALQADHEKWGIIRIIDVFNQQVSRGNRKVLEKHYNAVVKAALPLGTVGDVSFKVMDINGFRPPGGPKDVKPPDAVNDTGGYSIEMLFPAQGSFAFIDALINLVQGAGNTFLAGYIGIRFMGQTRAFLGMQQWNQTCSVEVATLPGIHGVFALLSDMLDLMRAHGGVPHWGQLLDLNSQGHAGIYPNFPKWREVYGSLSNNFTTRTFENDLSVRWQLTLPPAHDLP